ncbi:FtsK/SpoIIIE domain-containing protein [Amnibacterium sp. CER49]|uniref:FtsK/SpoIIIE domain-containing protein n=1 Tax=Amnibacterium sp. CER49 TaxID=3039161 RepID=UPI002448ED44|nr:FtsK/SpoIIIE domain-containing protein [Amnibacterium sp. CER49]MDH2445080.1 FtsK/SpoIIIE domain-containing protein [Amnibacterium sp. CER49]
MTDRLDLPPRPARPEAPGFPLLGVLAPLAGSIALALALQSPAMLLLAALAPVVAVGAVLDGRFQARRRLRRDTAAHEAALDGLEADLERLRTEREAALRRRQPGPAELLTGRWRPAPGAELVLGRADAPVAPLVGGRAATEREQALLAAGRTLRGVPFTVPGTTRVAVEGQPLLAGAFARAVAVAAARSTGSVAVPPVGAGNDADLVVRVSGPTRAEVVHAAPGLEHLRGAAFVPALVTAAALAALERLLPGTPAPPLAALLAEPPTGGGLPARFVVDGGGVPVDIDLVADGPHAVVAGTTGSGKSALLSGWILALAAANPPERLALLLVDCKGGATFDPLAGLPHVTGVVTDLDGEGTERAVASLRAELVRREALLRDLGLPGIDGSGEPRLVIVVDEFRALLEARPALAGLFVDLAARGRSLGVHLVLCTQRPAGSVRDELLANCALRICLRVNDEADSRAMTGIPDAALLPRSRVGAAVLAVPGERPRTVAVARVAAADVDAVPASAAGSRARRPWLEPLPAVLPPDRLPAPAPGVVLLGLIDRPDRQEQVPLAWDVARRPRLLVAGDAGSGRSTALAAVCAAIGAAEAGTDAAVAWDLLHDTRVPLVLDDLEHLVDRLGAHGQAALDRLAVRLRDPAAAPTVLALRGPSGWAGSPLRPLVGLFDDRLLLRLGLDDHLALGGDRAAWCERLPPGGGSWRGERAQVVLPASPLPRHPHVPAPPLEPGRYLLLSERAADRVERLQTAGWAAVPAGEEPVPAPSVAYGTPAAWQAQWSALSRLAATLPVLVDRVAAADVRTLLGRGAPLPPVVADDEVVLIAPQREPIRVRLPR